MNDKWLSLMVCYVERKTLYVKCELLQMITLDAVDCFASKIFDSFKNEFLKKNIILKIIVGFACDNASVMVGKKLSFKTKLIAENPNLITFQCMCHSSALAVKEAIEVILKDYDIKFY